MSLHHHFIATLVLLIAAVVARAEPAAIGSADDDVRRVFELAQARLSVMRDVAAWKHANNVPVTDAAREQKVLDASVAEAQRLGIDATSARELFSLQIRMARDVQEHFLATWRKTGRDTDRVRDLNKELRPELDRLGAQLLQVTYLALPELARADFIQRRRELANVIDMPGIETDDREQFLEALSALKSVPTPALERI
ncbi:MAG: gamma subclass chorismate mutase AroQ, partial [Steroidobacter sp.]